MTGRPNGANWGKYMTETEYWTRQKKHLANRAYVWKVNASYVRGIPDVWISGQHQDLWIENKRIFGDKDPPVVLDLTDHKKYLSLHQQQWLTDRHNEGRNVGVLVFSHVGHLYLPGIKFKETISKLYFLENAMPYKEMAENLIAIVGELEVK